MLYGQLLQSSCPAPATLTGADIVTTWITSKVEGKIVTEFEKFKKERFEQPPTDFPWNPNGFRRMQGSDISSHLPMLQLLAGYCQTVTEFGTRDAFSTCAFLAGIRPGGTVTSYDIHKTYSIQQLLDMKLPAKFVFHQKNTADPELKIARTDLLFIDTLHTRKQVEDELRQIHLVNRFLVFHDTFSQWEKSMDVPEEDGIKEPIEELMGGNAWNVIYRVDFNHGLIVLERNAMVSR